MKFPVEAGAMTQKTGIENGTDSGSVLVLGPLFLDIVMGPLGHLPEPGTELWTDHAVFAAGGAANQAVALARLGTQTALRSYIGEDTAGDITEALLLSEGVDISKLVRTETQSVTVSLSLKTDRAMVTRGSDAAPRLDPGDPPAALLADLRAIGKNRAVIKEWMTSSEPPLVFAEVGWDPTETWDPAILDHLDLVDYFLPNEEEALAYTRTQTATDAAIKLNELVDTVIVTRGSAGSLVCVGGQTEMIAAPLVEPLDPTGAGDTFSAGLAHALLRGDPLSEATQFGNKAAAFSVQNLGGSVSAPTHSQLDAWVPKWPVL